MSPASFVLLHGAAGFFDELVIVVIAVGVLFVAIRLAGRTPAEDDEDLADDVAPPSSERVGDDPRPTPS